MKKKWIVCILAVSLAAASIAAFPPNMVAAETSTQSGTGELPICEVRDDTLYVQGSGGLNRLPDTVYAKSFTKIVIMSGITSIGSGTFKDCGNVTSVELPSSVTRIASSAFENCTSLVDFDFPAGVTRIGNAAFKNCISLSGINLPLALARMEKEAFYGCSSLTSIEIPSRVSYLEEGVFGECVRLADVKLSGSVIHIGNRAFYHCPALTKIEIPYGVSTIGNDAFAYCTSLQDIRLPYSLTEIGNRAFSVCSPAAIEVPAGVLQIGKGAFANCEALRSIDIPSSVTSIGANTFEGCPDLTIYGEIGSYADTYADGSLKFHGYYISGSQSSDGQSPIFEWSDDYESCIVKLAYPTNPNLIVAYDADVRKVTKIPASCISKGITRYTAEYGTFRDYADVEDIPQDAENHRNTEVRNEVLATSSKAGYTGDIYCKDCGARIFAGSPVTRLTDEDIVSHGKCGEGVYWELYDDGTLYIYGTGAMNGSIPWSSFQGQIYNICVEEGVTNIAAHAFENCIGLGRVELPESLTELGESAFLNCNTLETIHIPDGVKKIDDAVFQNCGSLRDARLPEGMTEMGNRVFYGCSSLKDIKIPEGISSIGNSMFKDCADLKNVTFPKSIVYIEENAFDGCTRLEEVALPNSLASIGQQAFENCDSLMYITIPTGTREIGEKAFFDCDSLKSAAVSGNVTTIEKQAFSECHRLKDVKIAEGVSGIGERAFENCTDLQNMTIPSSIKEIGAGAYANCIALKRVEIPDSMKAISNSTFSGCSKLERVDIPKEVTEISSSSFSGCSKLTIYGDCGSYAEAYAEENQIPFVGYRIVEASVSKYGEPRFDFSEYGDTCKVTVTSEGDPLQTNTYQVDVEAIVKEAATCSKMGVTRYIATYDTYRSYKDIKNIPLDATNHQNLELRNCVIATTENSGYSGDLYCKDCGKRIVSGTEIPKRKSDALIASGSCGKSVTWELYPNGELYINGTGSMYDWISSSSPWRSYGQISNVVIAEGVTHIGSNAFRNSSNLKNVVLPSSLTSMGDNAFYGCGSLQNIIIPESVTAIPNGVFVNCASLRDISLPSRINRIGSIAFSGCSSLQKINIPTGVTSIGNATFQDCKRLEEVSLPESLSDMGPAVFVRCTALKEVVFPEKITQIPDSVCTDCTSLESVQLPVRMKRIGIQAFAGCVHLEKMVIPEDASEIGQQAFYGCANLESIEIPCNVTRIGDSTFDNIYYLTIYGETASYAEQYAKEHNINFVSNKEATVHQYGSPVFHWADDGRTCKVSLTSKTKPIHTVTYNAKVTSEEILPATCVSMGTTQYTAVYEAFKDTKEIQDIPVNAANHVGGTELRGIVEATKDTEGYTGDTYCKSCGQKITSGTVIPKKTDQGGDNTGGGGTEGGGGGGSAEGGGSTGGGGSAEGGGSTGGGGSSGIISGGGSTGSAGSGTNSTGSGGHTSGSTSTSTSGAGTTTTTKTTLSDGILVTRTVAEDAAGQKTITSVFKSGKNAVSVVVRKNKNGKILTANADITTKGSAVSNGIKMTLENALLSQVAEAAGTDNVMVNAIVLDQNKDIQYTLVVKAEDLRDHKPLYLYEYNKKSDAYTMVNAKAYQIGTNGKIQVTADEAAHYCLVDSAKSAKIAKKLLKTIKLATGSKTVKAGRTTQIKFAGTMDEQNIKKVSYSSSNKKIAAVSSSGKITAKKAGSVNVTVKVTLKNGQAKTLQMHVNVK